MAFALGLVHGPPDIDGLVILEDIRVMQVLQGFLRTFMGLEANESERLIEIGLNFSNHAGNLAVFLKVLFQNLVQLLRFHQGHLFNEQIVLLGNRVSRITVLENLHTDAAFLNLRSIGSTFADILQSLLRLLDGLELDVAVFKRFSSLIRSDLTCNYFTEGFKIFIKLFIGHSGIEVLDK